MPKPRDIVIIDGSQGEGGGQVVRTSVALAIVTGTPVRLENVRARRAKPGLMRQHLTSVRAAAAISDGVLAGAELGATAFEFAPGDVRGGDYEFTVGTAGSVALVLQTVLPALIAGRCAARVAVEGGSHAKMAPPFDFLDAAYGRVLRTAGVGFHVTLERYGFYPAGGGRIVCDVDATEGMKPVDLRLAHPFETLRAVATSCDLPDDVARRELDALRDALGETLPATYDVVRCTARSPGNTLHVLLEGSGAAEVFTVFGERGVRAEALGAALGAEVRAFLETGVPVGPHLADQLLVLSSVGAGGAFRTVPLTLHSRTLLELIPRFLDVEIVTNERADGTVDVEVRV